jgi:hydrogenase expression/formation protein HypC
MCLAVPGRIVEVFDDRGTRMATVDFGGARKTICLAYLPDLQVDAYVIVHVGFAISQVDEQSALDTLQMFSELGIDIREELGVVDEAPAGSTP